jgi:CDP-glycerol glycerophosphotransferase
LKIDKKNPRHWVCLLLFGINVMCAIVCRLFVRRRGAGRLVILYGHKLAGNLLALYRHVKTTNEPDIHMVFLTMDKHYHRQLVAEGIASVLATAYACQRLLRRADAVISDHGLHAMAPMLSLSDMKFFDVWHGIPFKGFDADDFRLQHRYDEVWVASPLLAKLYVERFGFDPAKVKVTGYARTDRLVRRDEDTQAIKRRLGLDGDDVGKIVLFAPTWKQDASQRSIYPFGLSEHDFLGALSALAERTSSTIVMRTHLNTGTGPSRKWPCIEYRSHGDYPDTEELLLISDVLVCDWSSIAFDWLLLDRPAIFLDVEPPFAKGLSLGQEYRYGKVEASPSGFLHSLERHLLQPAVIDPRAAKVRQDVYGDYADGTATVCCISRLHRCIARGGCGAISLY